MSARFLIGVGAWLLGAGAATGGSLLAVSLLGQSLAPAASQQLTSAAVSQALASAARETPTPSLASTPPPTPARRPHRAKPAAQATPTASTQTTTTVLTSEGGSVVAECQRAGAYLVSWNPNSGYQVVRDTRGPAATAKVTFERLYNTYYKDVLMAVTCANGVPSANTTVSYRDE